eukprot:COSAG02_NODE_4005_length_5922_cov_40.612227_2_plen_733_part_00
MSAVYTGSEEGSGDLLSEDGGCRLPDVSDDEDKAATQPTARLTLHVDASILSSKAAQVTLVRRIESDLAATLDVISDSVVVQNLRSVERRRAQAGAENDENATMTATFDLVLLSSAGPSAMLRLQDQLNDPSSPLFQQGRATAQLQPAEIIVEYRCPAGLRRSGTERICSRCPYPQFANGAVCEDCPVNREPNNVGDGCRCDKGYYDKTDGLILCFGTEGYREDEVRSDVADQTSDALCEPCPACVDCRYPGYEGAPILKVGWAAVAGPGWFESSAKDSDRFVFQCPIKQEACLAEQPPQFALNLSTEANAVSGDNSSSNATCEIGYEGMLCAQCSKGTHTRSMRECKECKVVTQESAMISAISSVVLLLTLLNVRYYVANHTPGIIMQALGRMLPDLVSDLKVFVGLYQVLTGMSVTLLIQYPVAVEEFFAWVRSLVNFDFFSIPALGCIIGTGAYVKFWSAMSLPLIIAFIVYCIYHRHMYKAHHDGFDDLVVDAVAKKQWAEAKRNAQRYHKWNKHSKRWKTKHPDKAPQPEEGTGGGRAVHHLMLQRAIDVANARQLCVGWGFMLIFLVYPSICTKTFAMFHCFKVDDETGFLVDDFEVKCDDLLYIVHKFFALIFVILYPVSFTLPACLPACLSACLNKADIVINGLPARRVIAFQIGIPLGVGWQLWRQRRAIKAGNGPSEFKMLYRDFKPDCCLWEIYGMLQKAFLVGLLGFIWPGVYAHVLVLS